MVIQRVIVKASRAPKWASEMPRRKKLRRMCRGPVSRRTATSCMMRPGTKVNRPAISKRAGEHRDHRLAMPDYVVAACVQHGERQHDQREDRQKMDRAPDAPHPQLVDPERRRTDDRHQRHPDPADGPMRERSLRGGELHEAERKSAHRREGVNLNCRRSVEQRLQRHGAAVRIRGCSQIIVTTAVVSRSSRRRSQSRRRTPASPR